MDEKRDGSDEPYCSHSEITILKGVDVPHTPLKLSSEIRAILTGGWTVSPYVHADDCSAVLET